MPPRTSARPQSEDAASDSSMTEELYRRLREDLLSGAIDPDELLLETTVSTRYATSRTPARAVLGRLEQAGLLQRHQRGYTVPQVSAEFIVHLYEIRIPLEGAAAAAAAERRTDLLLARITHAHADGEGGPIERRARFHRAVREASLNPPLVETLDRVIDQIRLFDRLAAPEEPEAQEDAAHAEILQAIRERDAEGARAAAVRHLEQSRDRKIAVLARLG